MAKTKTSFVKGDPRAGRPKGKPNKLTKKLHDQLAGTDDDPVKILLEIRRVWMEQAQAALAVAANEDESPAARANASRWAKECHELASKAAGMVLPHVHPKLRYSTIEMDFAQMPSVEIRMIKPEGMD